MGACRFLLIANFDIFNEQFRRYQNGILVPTSHGDFLDRAVNSLAKELRVPVSINLVNAQAVKVRMFYLVFTHRK